MSFFRVGSAVSIGNRFNRGPGVPPGEPPPIHRRPVAWVATAPQRPAAGAPHPGRGAPSDVAGAPAARGAPDSDAIALLNRPVPAPQGGAALGAGQAFAPPTPYLGVHTAMAQRPMLFARRPVAGTQRQGAETPAPTIPAKVPHSPAQVNRRFIASTQRQGAEAPAPPIPAKVPHSPAQVNYPAPGPAYASPYPSHDPVSAYPQPLWQRQAEAHYQAPGGYAPAWQPLPPQGATRPPNPYSTQYVAYRPPGAAGPIPPPQARAPYPSSHELLIPKGLTPSTTGADPYAPAGMPANSAATGPTSRGQFGDQAVGSVKRSNAVRVSAGAQRAAPPNTPKNRQVIAQLRELTGGKNVQGAIIGGLMPEVLTVGRREYRIIASGERGGYGEFFYAVEKGKPEAIGLKTLRGAEEYEALERRYGTVEGTRATYVRRALAEVELTQILSPGLGVQSLIQDTSKTSYMRMKMFRGAGDTLLMNAAPADKKLLGRTLFAGVLDGLEHVHAQGYMHCDVKLQNVLWASDGSIALSDYGLAQKGAEVHNRLIGTIAAPEMHPGENRWGPKADLFAACISLAASYHNTYQNVPFLIRPETHDDRMFAFKMWRDEELYPETRAMGYAQSQHTPYFPVFTQLFSEMKKHDPALYRTMLGNMLELNTDRRDDVAAAKANLAAVGHTADAQRDGVRLIQNLPADTKRDNIVAALSQLES